MEAQKPKIGESIGRETAMNNASMSAVSVCVTKLLARKRSARMSTPASEWKSFQGEMISAYAILKKRGPTRIMTVDARIANTKHMICHCLNHH
jgi:hypothetical protein